MVDGRRVHFAKDFVRNRARDWQKVGSALGVVNGVELTVDNANFDRKVDHHVMSPRGVNDADHFEVDREHVVGRGLARKDGRPDDALRDGRGALAGLDHRRQRLIGRYLTGRDSLGAVVLDTLLRTPIK